MEADLKKTVQVELFGPPGCGKSTVARIIADRLRELGYTVAEPSRAVNASAVKHLKKAMVCLRYCLGHPGKIGKISGIIKDNNYTGKEFLLQMINICLKLHEYQKEGKNVLVWDEGMVQAGISLAVNGNADSGDNIRKLLDISNSDILIVPILLEVDTDTVIKRIENRKNGFSRADRMEGGERRTFIEKFAECTENAGKSGIEVIRIRGTERQPDELAEEAVRYIAEAVHRELSDCAG